MSDRQRLETLRQRARLAELRQKRDSGLAPGNEQSVIADMRAPAPRKPGMFNDGSGFLEKLGDNPVADGLRARFPDLYAADDALSQSRVAAAMAGGVQGASLGFDDEIASLPAALIPGGETGQQARDRIRARNEDHRDRHPLSYFGGEVGGALASGKGVTSLRGVAGLGAAYGAGTTEGGATDRGTGAAIGGTIGAGAKVGLDKLGRAVSPLLKRTPKAVDDVPELDDLKDVKNALYREADDAGAVYSPDQINALFRGVGDEVPTEGLGRITPRTHPTASAMLRQMQGQTQKPASLMELDKLRALSGSASPMNPQDQRLAGIIRQNIDEFTESMKPAAGGDATETLQRARAANSRYRKAEMVDEAIEKARRRAGRTGSGGNEQNALRQNISSILDNPKRRRGFTPEEIDQMERIVMGSPSQNLTRLIGKLSPEGNGLMTALGIGGAAANPMLALGSAAGFGAKRMSDSAAQKSIDDLVRLVRTGNPVAPQPTKASSAVTDPELQALMAKLSVVGAN